MKQVVDISERSAASNGLWKQVPYKAPTSRSILQSRFCSCETEPSEDSGGDSSSSAGWEPMTWGPWKASQKSKRNMSNVES